MMTRTPTTLAIATLAAFGLAAHQPARAQSLLLNSGDTITVSGAGTVGTLNNAPVANPAATSYTDAGGNNLNGNKAGVETDGTSSFTLAAGGALTGSGNALLALGTGPVSVTGGTITGTGSGSAVDGGSGSTITISGGTITSGANSFGIYTNGTITITGGSIPSVAGFSGFALATGGGGVIDLFGTNFSYTPVGGTATSILSGPLSTATNFDGVLTGTLLNGQPLSTNYGDFGTIEVNVGTPPAAPEPSQWAAFGVGLLGLGALALKARKRANAASA